MQTQARARRNLSSSTSGYTLIEFASVIAILAIIGTLSAVVTVEAIKVHGRTSTALDASYQARLGVERILRDVRDLKNRASITSFTSTALTFDDANDVTQAYSFSGGNLTHNGDLLAQGLTSFAFTYWESDGTTASVAADLHLVEVDLTVAVAGEPYRLQSVAFPRYLSP